MLEQAVYIALRGLKPSAAHLQSVCTDPKFIAPFHQLCLLVSAHCTARYDVSKQRQKQKLLAEMRDYYWASQAAAVEVAGGGG
jgi:hypothetical protein